MRKPRSTLQNAHMFKRARGLRLLPVAGLADQERLSVIFKGQIVEDAKNPAWNAVVMTSNYDGRTPLSLIHMVPS